MDLARMTNEWLAEGNSITSLASDPFIEHDFRQFRKATWGTDGSCNKRNMVGVALQAKAVGNVVRLIHRKGRPLKSKRKED